MLGVVWQYLFECSHKHPDILQILNFPVELDGGVSDVCVKCLQLAQFKGSLSLAAGRLWLLLYLVPDGQISARPEWMQADANGCPQQARSFQGHSNRIL